MNTSDIFVLAVVFLVIDSIFLYLMSGRFKSMVLAIQGEQLSMKIIPTIACYIFLIFSLYYFIVSPRASHYSAFLLGLCIYGVFETTSLAIFQKWDLTTALVDTVWGGILFASTYHIWGRIVGDPA